MCTCFLSLCTPKVEVDFYFPFIIRCVDKKLYSIALSCFNLSLVLSPQLIPKFDKCTEHHCYWL